jgi:GT2 family glycosyltransferase
MGGFDENIFLYFEDNDLCRKILKEGYRTVVNPFVSVVHDHNPKSFFNIKNIMIYFKSGIYYFNKWGWIFDKDRIIENRKTMKLIKKS